MFFCLANSIRFAIGSAPGESTKMIGVPLEESIKEPSKSNGGLSMNFLPIFYEMYFLIAWTSFSSLMTLIIISY